MVRQQRASKVHEDTYPLRHSRGTLKHQQDKDEQVKHDLLDPPRYLRRAGDFRGKALSFGVLDCKQFEKTNDTTTTTTTTTTTAEGTKEACCSYASAETATSSLELDLSTGVVKRSELDLKTRTAVGNFPRNMRSERFSVRSQKYSDAGDADEKGKLDHKPLSRKQKASTNKNLVEKEQSNNASELSSCISPSCSPIFSRQTNQGSETSSRILSEALRKVDCQDRRNDVAVESSSPVNVVERNQISVEKQDLLDQKITTLISKTRRDASPNRRFSFSFSQMGRSFSSKESSSTVPALLSPSHASAKSGPLSSGHSRTRSGPFLKPKTEKIVPTKPRPPPTTVHALLQFTLRKGINLFQFVVENNNNVLAATLKKSSDSSTRSYTLYSVKEVTKKSDSWLGRHRKEDKNHPFAHTVIGQMKTVTSFTSDLSTHKSESILFGVETNEELAAIVQTRSRTSKRHSTTIILPSGVHTLPKDGNAPLPLIERWKSGGACDCGGWDIGCKLRVLYYDDPIKPHTFSSFQLFDQERDQPAFKMVTHDDELHSVEFGSTISLLEAFFISLAVSSNHQSWCEALIGDGPLKRETPAKYASNPPVSPIGRV